MDGMGHGLRIGGLGRLQYVFLNWQILWTLWRNGLVFVLMKLCVDLLYLRNFATAVGMNYDIAHVVFWASFSMFSTCFLTHGSIERTHSANLRRKLNCLAKKCFNVIMIGSSPPPGKSGKSSLS